MRITKPFAVLMTVSVLYATEPPEVHMNVMEIIAYYGYPAELVDVKTDDGYFLQMHRIPHGKNETGSEPYGKRPVVFLQHGLLASSADWVINTDKNSAAFLFADAGFDVWMGNVRGNIYSTEHEKFSRSTDEYWRFSWDEMSKYDLDAMINRVLQITKQPDLYYVAHSQGTLIMFTKLATDQQFATKIRKFFALAPVATVANIQGLMYYIAEISRRFPMLDKLLGNRDFLPNSWFNKLFSRYICGWHYVNPFCDNVLFQIGGPDNQFNQSRVPVFLAHTPAGTSTQNIRHWRQMVQSGNTQAYDYGSAEENMKHYSQATAPLYDLSRVSTRVYLYWSDKDWLATETDIKRSLLPKIQPQFLKQNNRLNDYNHFDFIWGLRAPDEIYKPIIRIISAHESRRHAWRYRR